MEKEIIDLILNVAKADERIRAVLMVGSRFGKATFYGIIVLIRQKIITTNTVNCG